jgi:hypothetical protein
MLWLLYVSNYFETAGLICGAKDFVFEAIGTGDGKEVVFSGIAAVDRFEM